MDEVVISEEVEHKIASRNLFKNTAYYNPSVRTDASGKAKVQFQLPDNVTDYRIIAIANTKDSRFGVAEKTLSVKKEIYYWSIYTSNTLSRRHDNTFISTV